MLKCDVFVHFVTSTKVVLFLWAHEIFLNYHFHTIQCYLLKRARSSSNCCCDGALYVLQNDSDKKIDHKPLFLKKRMGSNFFRGKNHDAAAAPNAPAECVMVTVSPKKVRILRKKPFFCSKRIAKVQPSVFLYLYFFL